MLVVGEEIGWRGYALPKLLQNHSAVTASLILGVLWGGWHLPTFFIAGSPQASIPFVAFLLFTTGTSVLFTWLYMPTGGSLLIATVFHGAINSFGFVNTALDPTSRWWLTGAVSRPASKQEINHRATTDRQSMARQDARQQSR